MRVPCHHRLCPNTHFHLTPGCKVCRAKRAEVCPHHAVHESTEITSADNKNNQQLPNAIESIPKEVGLCMSSIPCAGLGVYARQHIPTGTWIGPYEGDILRSEEMRVGIDSSYMWEVGLVLQ